MTQTYSIDYLGSQIGTFSVPLLESLHYTRSYSRIFFNLPLILNLNVYSNKENLHPKIQCIRGYLKLNTNKSLNIDYTIGDLSNQEIFHYPIRDNLLINLQCETNIADLLEWERLRNGNEINGRLELNYTNSYQSIDENDHVLYQSKEKNKSISIPYPIPQKVWMDFINRLNLFEYHLFELNNPIQDSEEMKRVSSTVREAIHFFYLGGSMNWKISVQKVREAMNHFGDLKKASKDKKTNEKTRVDRWLDYFLALKALPNLAVHGEVDNAEWSREEAQAILTSFLGIWNIKDSILAERKLGQSNDVPPQEPI